MTKMIIDDYRVHDAQMGSQHNSDTMKSIYKSVKKAVNVSVISGASHC